MIAPIYFENSPFEKAAAFVFFNEIAVRRDFYTISDK
jgi:hypothetical protein